MSTQRIARFLVETSYDEIPAEVVAEAKKHILDGLGVTLEGSREKVGRLIVEYVRELGGKPQAGVIGCGFRTSSPLASLANGTMAHASDYDDSTWSFGGHPTAVLLPAVLALGERDHISGKAVLEAFVLGWELGVRICAAVGEGAVTGLGWHGTAIVGTMAATAASAKVLKLDVQQTARAFGIAASEAGGLRQNFGTDTKPFHAGKAASNGVTAALLASKGFTANESILEAPLGLSQVLMRRECEVSRLDEGLGAPYDIISPRTRMKRHPCCGMTHRSIDAVLELLAEHRFTADDVVEVECNTHPMIPKVLIYPRPKAGLEGKFSMQYCVAAALLDGEVTLRQFTDEKVMNPRAQDLVGKVRFAHPQNVTGTENVSDFPQTVTVALKDGRRYSRRLPFVKGSTQNPMSWDETASKFEECAQGILSPDDIQRTVELMSKLERLEDIAGPAEIVSGSSYRDRPKAASMKSHAAESQYRAR